MVAGGSDPFSKVAFTGFERLGAVAPDICQPFDKNRKGMLIGEGAGMLVLESLESAFELLLGEAKPKRREPLREGMTAGVLAQNQLALSEPDILRTNDFVGAPVFENAILMNP